MRYVLSLTLLLLLLTGCANSSETSAENQDAIEVVGRMTIRGAEPFTTPMLETEDGFLYVLNMENVEGELPQNEEVRVEGELYSDTWNGKRLAHLRVTEWAAE